VGKKRKRSRKQRKAVKRKQYSGIDSHKMSRGRMISPLGQFQNLTTVDWDRHLLPEHIWLDQLSVSYPDDKWHIVFNKFLDVLDEYAPKDITLYGLVTDFGHIPEDKREEILDKYDELIHDAFYLPAGRILALYPESPCHWLVKRIHVEADGPLDPDTELKKLGDCIMRLMDAKSLRTGHVRAVPLSRALKHQRVMLSDKLMTKDLLPKYPEGCSDEEKYHVQSFARTFMNMMYLQNEQYRDVNWPKYFWRHGRDLVPCKPVTTKWVEPSTVEVKIDSLFDRLMKNAECAIRYLDDVANKYIYDLYDTTRDEVLLGLFSRVTRLFVLVCSNPDLWARDTVGVFLRLLADAVIVFTYLVKKGEQQELQRFKEFSDGKEKLLMLHLQDNYPELKSVDGKTPEEIAQDLGGGMHPELIDIEFTSWTKKKPRDLAYEVGLEKYYRLVYSPSSEDVHGSWTSIRKSNLVRCVQPLHRFHWMPKYSQPSLYLDPLELVLNMYFHCQGIGVEALGFPESREEMNPVLMGHEEMAAVPDDGDCPVDLLHSDPADPENSEFSARAFSKAMKSSAEHTVFTLSRCLNRSEEEIKSWMAGKAEPARDDIDTLESLLRVPRGSFLERRTHDSDPSE
jgi:uncharacterized protein DUF5677